MFMRVRSGLCFRNRFMKAGRQNPQQVYWEVSGMEDTRILMCDKATRENTLKMQPGSDIGGIFA